MAAYAGMTNFYDHNLEEIRKKASCPIFVIPAKNGSPFQFGQLIDPLPFSPVRGDGFPDFLRNHQFLISDFRLRPFNPEIRHPQL